MPRSGGKRSRHRAGPGGLRGGRRPWYSGSRFCTGKEVLQDPAARLHGLNCLMAHYTRRADWPVSDGMLGATAVFRLRVTSWTAKEHKVP